MMKISFIDHYDSFSFNLIDWLAKDSRYYVERIAFDDSPKMRQFVDDPRPLVLSPGPKAPADAEETLRLLAAVLGKVPVFGVCLGHQMLAYHLKAQVVRSKVPRHGATRSIKVGDRTSGLFRGMPATFEGAAYNSLTVAPDSLPDSCHITALCGDGEVQGLEWAPAGVWPAYGVQYHPESFLSQLQDIVLTNWLAIVDEFYSNLEGQVAIDGLFYGREPHRSIDTDVSRNRSGH